MKPENRRGRPKGTDLPADRKTLADMAELLLREPGMRPTAAIKKLVPTWTDSVVHRLLGKWRNQREALLAKARERAEARAVAAVQSPSGDFDARTVRLLALSQSFQGRTAFLTAQRLMDTPTMRMMREIKNSPTVRMMRALQDNPTVRMMRTIQNGPTMLAMRAMQDSPVMRAIHKARNNPLARMGKAQALLAQHGRIYNSRSARMCQRHGGSKGEVTGDA